MGEKRPEVDTEEYIQSQLERQVREQCELHGWATAVSVANPVDILILFEEFMAFDPTMKRKEINVCSNQNATKQHKPKLRIIPKSLNRPILHLKR